MISYEGIDEADLIHGLYHGTRAQGMGMLHNTPNLSVEDVRDEFADPGESGRTRIDYYRGRPLKVGLDIKAKIFDERLYDRDAGQGAAARVVEALRKKAT